MIINVQLCLRVCMCMCTYTVVSRASAHSRVSARVSRDPCSSFYIYKCMKVISRVSAHVGQNHELCLSAHERLPGTLSSIIILYWLPGLSWGTLDRVPCAHQLIIIIIVYVHVRVHVGMCTCMYVSEGAYIICFVISTCISVSTCICTGV